MAALFTPASLAMDRMVSLSIPCFSMQAIVA